MLDSNKEQKTATECDCEQRRTLSRSLHDIGKPVRRHVWRCTSEPERDKSIFGVTSISRLSGFRDNQTADARANMQSPHLRLL